MSENKVTNKTDTIVKVILVFAISLLSFGIGAFVGKSYGERQAKLASLEPKAQHVTEQAAANPHEVATAHGEGHETASNTEELNQDDLAKLAEEFVNDEKVANDPSNSAKEEDHGITHSAPAHTAAAPAPAAAPTHTTAKAHTSTAATTVAPQHKAPVRQPTSLPSTVAQSSLGKYTIQVASFSTEDEAQKRTLGLKDRGFTAFYTPADVAGQTWYRVNVGLYSSQKEALEHKSELMEKAQIASAIIKKLQ